MTIPMTDAELATWGFHRYDLVDPWWCEALTHSGQECTRKALYDDVHEKQGLCRQHAQRRAQTERDRAQASNKKEAT